MSFLWSFQLFIFLKMAVGYSQKLQKKPVNEPLLMKVTSQKELIMANYSVKSVLMLILVNYQ